MIKRKRTKIEAPKVEAPVRTTAEIVPFVPRPRMVTPVDVWLRLWAAMWGVRL